MEQQQQSSFHFPPIDLTKVPMAVLVQAKPEVSKDEHGVIVFSQSLEDLEAAKINKVVELRKGLSENTVANTKPKKGCHSCGGKKIDRAQREANRARVQTLKQAKKKSP